MENSIFKKEFVYIAILGGWLWGCGSGNDRAAFSEQGGKEIILENISTVPLRERIDSVWCVPLETTDSSLVSSVASLQIMDDRFYMLDGTYASILIFDKQGRYINGIYGQGKGTKEYIRICDMQLDRLNRQIVVSDQFSKKLLIYDRDGRWVKTVPFRDCWAPVVPFMQDRYVQINDGREMYLPEDMQKWNLTLFDDRGEPLANWLPDQTPNRIDFVTHRNVCTFDNGEFCYAPLFSSTIYRIGLDSIVPAYRLINRLEGIKSLSENDLQRIEYILEDKQCSYVDYQRQPYFLPGAILNSPQMLCVFVDVQDSPYYIFYDKELDCAEIFDCNRSPLPDLKHITVDQALDNLLCAYPLCIDGRTFYVELNHVHKILMGDKDPGPKFAPVYDALGENDNPILVAYTLKRPDCNE